MKNGGTRTEKECVIDRIGMDIGGQGVNRCHRRRSRRNLMKTDLGTVVMCVGNVDGVAVEGIVREGEDAMQMRGKLHGARYVPHLLYPWVNVYLREHPTYPDVVLRRRFRLPHALSMKLHNDIYNFSPTIWKARYDGLGTEWIRSEIEVLV